MCVIMKMIIVLFSVVVACVKGCSVPGISQGHNPQEFILCANQSGTILKSNFLCDEDFVFLNSKKICSHKSLNIKTLNEKKTCTETGQSCQDCSTSQMCIKVKDEIIQVGHTDCANDEVCVDKACRKKNLGYNCYEQKFVCAWEGVFPDPTDCTKFHYCIANGNTYVDIERKCPEGYFDLYGNCGNECPLSFPLCHIPYEARAVANSTFYVCILDGSYLSPYFYKCPNGSTFDESTLSCV